MKTVLSAFVLFLLSSISLYGQQHPFASSSGCEEYLTNLQQVWNQETIQNYEQVKPVSYALHDVLDSPSKVEKYFALLTGEEAHVGTYDGNTKILQLLPLNEFIQSASGPETKHKIETLARSSLREGNKIYLMKMQLPDGKVVDNYVVCDTDSGQVVWDSIFFNVMIFRKSN